MINSIVLKRFHLAESGYVGLSQKPVYALAERSGVGEKGILATFSLAVVHGKCAVRDREWVKYLLHFPSLSAVASAAELAQRRVSCVRKSIHPPREQGGKTATNLSLRA